MYEKYKIVQEQEQELMSPVAFPWKHYYDALCIAKDRIHENKKYHTIIIPYYKRLLSVTFIQMICDNRLYLYDMEVINKNIDQLRDTLGTLRNERRKLNEPIEKITRTIEAIEDIIDRDIQS